MDAPAQPDIGLLHQVHETLAGRMPESWHDVLARAILAGLRDDALRLLAPLGVPDAAAYADGLIALARHGRPVHAGIDGAGVRDDLASQPCQSDVAELAANGHRDAAAVLAVLHEGYPGAAARAAADMLATEMAGTAVGLVEIDPARADLAPNGSWDGPPHLARIGDALIPGLFRSGPRGTLFEDRSGRRLPLSRVGQAWKVLPR